MSAMIGTAPDQVPTVQMLGTMAFQDGAGVTISGGTVGGVDVANFPAMLAASTGSVALLTAGQVNSSSTVTTSLTGHAWTILPGKTLQINGVLVCTSAATTTGFYYGVSVAQGAGADGEAVGRWFAYVNLAATAAATGLSNGDVVGVAAGATVIGGVLGSSTTVGNNGAMIDVVIKNTSSNASTTVTLEFRTEVNASAVTALAGSAAVARTI